MASVREPCVSGQFYPSGRKELEGMIDGFLKGGEPSSSAVIAPHAGYVYSGRTAALAISDLSRASSYIVIGPNHTGRGSEFASWGNGEWKTPLGSVGIDRVLNGEIVATGLVKEDPAAHITEHSIEVQLPIMQKVLGDFRFVPLSMMNSNYSGSFQEECQKLGEALAGILKARDDPLGIVVSSDFSHYMPIEDAREVDGEALRMIFALDVEGLFEVLLDRQATICGYGPIAVLMEVARSMGWQARLLSESSSGDENGDYESVVTYYGVGFGAELPQGRKEK